MIDRKETIDFIINEEKEGTRLDLVLSLELPDISRSYIQKLIEQGNVSVDGKTETSKKVKLKNGAKVSLYIPEPSELVLEPENIDIEIVYEDADVLIVNKPKGMVVHPGPGNYEHTLVNALMYHCKDRLSSINGVIRPGIVHRIDKDTSGLLMVAKNDAAHESLASQLAVHSVKRRYKAVCYSNFREDEGTIDRPIGRNPSNRLKMAVTEVNSKKAVTHYKVLERFGDFTLIEARLETGRTHQIRVHMAYIKHPLLGDFVYGPEKNKFGVTGQMLHAGVLGFVHPSTGEYMEFTSPLPDEFERILELLRGKK